MNKEKEAAIKAARQYLVDEQTFSQTLSSALTVHLIEMALAVNQSHEPVVFMPELKFQSMLKDTLSVFPEKSCFVITDNDKNRLSDLKHCVRDIPHKPNLHFDSHKYNIYKDGAFDLILSVLGAEASLSLESTLCEFLRLLRQGGSVCIAVPMPKNFSVLFDMIEEVAYLAPDLPVYVERYRKISVDSVLSIAKMLPVRINGYEIVEHNLIFKNVVDFLAASYYKYYLRAFVDQIEKGVTVSSDISRYFSTFFAGLPIVTPLSFVCLSLEKN